MDGPFTTVGIGRGQAIATRRGAMARGRENHPEAGQEPDTYMVLPLSHRSLCSIKPASSTSPPSMVHRIAKTVAERRFEMR